MTETSQHDAWQAGDSYDVYMGRWSRAVASLFLDWLDAGSDREWLDVGCGTGALTSAIVARCSPMSVVSIDMSDTFIAKARASLGSAKVDFRVGSADPLDLPANSRDVVVSALLLNFLPNKENALAEARRVARRGGLIGFYVWDYPGHGLEFVDAFGKPQPRLMSQLRASTRHAGSRSALPMA
jgi:ubiquinone/menaquinone biosynthesis C-methylase UbiE